MPYRFKKKESVARAVRRLCCERLDEALETLEKGSRLDAVHDVRKEIKKLRSVLRLVRRDIGKSAYSKNTEALRQAADLLNDFRDAQVKLNAFDGLVKYFSRKLPANSFPEIRSALQKNCHTQEKKLGRSIKPLKGILSRSKERIDDLKVGAKGWKAIAPGLKKIYCRGRESFETTRRQPAPEHFHEWRKRVKDLWHQLRLLCPTRPRSLLKRIERLEKLGDVLGDDHDLFMLNEFAAGFNDSRDAKTLAELISARQKKLRSRALKLGGRFYHERANHFCRQIGDYWKTWRRNR